MRLHAHSEHLLSAGQVLQAVELSREHSSILGSGKSQRVQVTSAIPGRYPFAFGKSA